MYSVIEETENKTLEMHSIHERLEQIRLYLEKEINLKQKTIEELEGQVGHLKTLSDDKNSLIGKLEAQLLECRQTNEGTRQLINKLLNDISNYQKDIEWYKRTYVKRSLPGTIWQKLFRK
jgi:chromosome segregation ATPase